MLFHSCKYCLGRIVWQQFISMEIVQSCTKIDCSTSNKYSHKKLTLMWIGIILLPDFFCNYCCQNSAGNISFKKSDFPHARVLYFRLCAISMLSAVCTLGCFRKTLFQENQKYNPTRISLGVSLKGSKFWQKDFWFWQSLGVPLAISILTCFTL